MKQLYRLFLTIQSFGRKWPAKCLLHWLNLRHPCATHHSKTVLILRPDALGDMLVSLSAIRQLSEHFSARGYRIILVHTAATSSIVSGCPFIDDTICIDKNQFAQSSRYRSAIAIRLRTLHPEYTVNLLALPRQAYLDHLLTLYADAAHSCCINPSSLLKRQGVCLDYSSATDSLPKRILRKLLPNPARTQALLDNWCMSWRELYDICPDAPETADIFQIEQHLVNTVCQTDNPPQMTFPDWLETADRPQLPAPYYIIASTAALHSKCWPEENFASVISAIHARHPELVPVLTGTERDRQTIEHILSLLPPSVHALSLCGQSTLPQLFSIIRGARFILGNDTGSAHVAGLLRKKAFTLSAGGHWNIYFPNRLYTETTVLHDKRPCFNCCFLCHGLTQDGRFPCLASIPADLVIQKILDYLGIHCEN